VGIHQKEELRRLADTGAKALILITNRLAQKDESSTLWKRRLEQLMAAVPDTMPLGFYECPYPYKRLLTDDGISFCAQTGRFQFLKDTCCDPETLQRRVSLTQGTALKLYNANTATLLDTLRWGGAGYSGVMANFHPRLYTWLCENWDKAPKKAEELQGFLTMCSYIENRLYPVNAKYYLKKLGIIASDYCRVQNRGDLTPVIQEEVGQLELISHKLEQDYLS
jgi:4-hydroxy-tetrahydrodipicolinate synthase